MRYFLKSAFIAAALAGPALAGATSAASQEALQVGATFLTSGLDAARGSNGWALVSHGIGEKLFAVDKDGVLGPELAVDATRTGELTWQIALAPGRFFSDGTPVSADTVAAGLANTTEHNPASLSTGGKLAFEALDELTLKVTTERPVPLIQALFAEWPLIVYHLNEDGSAVFSGPYAVADFAPDARAHLVANPHFPGAEDRSDVVWRRFGDAQTMALAFEAGELDLAFGLPSEVVPRLSSHPELEIRSFPVGYQYFAFLNTDRPHLAEVKVRQAIDLVIDREQLAAAINGGAPASGAYAPYFPFAGKEPRPTDAARAAALLDEAGWTTGSGGRREKDGETLSLLVLAYPQRPDLVTMLPVVRAALAGLGIEVETRVVENVNEVAASGEFDLLLWAQHTAPSGDPAFFLDSMLRSGAALNHARYADADFDAVIDRFAETGETEHRIRIAHEAQEKLFRDVPISFLVSPEWYVGVSRRLENYEPWGSDYHVLRAVIGEAR